MATGKILLTREKEKFLASFCIMNKTLQELTEQLAFLHPDEKAYYDTLKSDKRKLSYLLGRITAKKSICELAQQNPADVLIEFGIFQFPVVKNSTSNQHLQVSISHCDHIGITLAFPENHPLGIDIEKIDPHKAIVMQSQMTATESALIATHNITTTIGYTALWTAKEALSKILKTGLTTDFQILEIKAMENADGMFISTFSHFSQYKAYSYQSNNYMCSIVLPKRTTPDLKEFWNIFTTLV